MHVPASRAGVYFGTPAVPVATFSEDGPHKLARSSSAFSQGSADHRPRPGCVGPGQRMAPAMNATGLTRNGGAQPS